MAPASTKKLWIFALFFICIAGLTAGGLFFYMEKHPQWGTSGANSRQSPEERYYQAVYLLRSFGGHASMEKETIPRRIPYLDTSEALLHHPDRILVLHRLADDLATLRQQNPKAVFYEACARLALGQRKAAADLLARYVIDNDYNENHYSLLSGTLYELGDYPSLLLICREWQERDPDCREERLRLAWAALHNLGRYDRAQNYMRADGACLGWRAAVYEAKPALSMEGTFAAEIVLERALKKYPENAPQIRRLWDILKEKNRV